MARLQMDLGAQAYVGARLVAGHGGQQLVCYSFDGFHVFVSVADAVRMLDDTVDIEAVADGRRKAE